MGGSLKEAKMTKKKTQTKPVAGEETYSDASGTDTDAKDGAEARLETMTPKNRRPAEGQVATTSGKRA